MQERLHLAPLRPSRVKVPSPRSMEELCDESPEDSSYDPADWTGTTTAGGIAVGKTSVQVPEIKETVPSELRTSVPSTVKYRVFMKTDLSDRRTEPVA